MIKTKSKLKENPFHITTKDHLIEVWLGEPNDEQWIDTNCTPYKLVEWSDWKTAPYVSLMEIENEFDI